LEQRLTALQGANREILPEDRKYILCTVDWEVILPDPNLCPVLLLDHYVPLTSGFGIVFWPSYAYMLLGSIAKLIDRLVLTFASQSQVSMKGCCSTLRLSQTRFVSAEVETPSVLAAFC